MFLYRMTIRRKGSKSNDLSFYIKKESHSPTKVRE